MYDGEDEVTGPEPDRPSDSPDALAALFPPNDRFELVSILGSGGMGVVFAARDRSQGGRAVALKVLRNVSPRSVLRFKREFRALAGVVHPNLVTLYELFVEDARVYFTLELVSGESFSEWTTGDRRAPTTDGEAKTSELPPARSAASRPQAACLGDVVDVERLRVAMKGLAAGVAAIHRAGMLHRDLKPSNVLLTPDGRAVVLDFGLVTESHADPGESQHRALEGTIDYMSPEQAGMRPIGPPSDWYTVGLMLYRALTGRLAYLGDLSDVLLDRQRIPPIPPSTLVPDVPEDLERLCLDLLAIEPSARPDADAVLRRLGCEEEIQVPVRAPVAHSIELIGRGRQLAALEDALAMVRSGRTVICEVRGAAGAGKSALLQAFLRPLAGREDVTVLTGRCVERESVAFKAVDGVMDELSTFLSSQPVRQLERYLPRDVHALTRLFPVLAELRLATSLPDRVLAPDRERDLAFAAAQDLFARIADTRTVVIALDDVQWGDRESAELLAAILRPPDAPTLLFVFCGLSQAGDRRGTFLKHLDQTLRDLDVDRREIAVGALPLREASEIVARLLSDRQLDREQITHVVTEASGNAYFLAELVRFLREHPGLPVGDQSLEAVLRARVSALPAEARRLIEVVSLARRPIPVELASHAASVEDPATLTLLKGAGLIRTRRAATDEVECYHERVRGAVLGLLDDATRRGLHLALAETLEHAPAPDPETLAEHLLAAGEPVRGARYALEAADRAVAEGDFGRAARHYRATLEHGALSAAERARVAQALAAALESAGRDTEAAMVLLGGASDSPPSARSRQRAAGLLVGGGLIDRVTAELGDVLADAGLSLGGPTLGSRLTGFLAHRKLRRTSQGVTGTATSADLAHLDLSLAAARGLALVDPVRGRDAQSRALLLALRSGDPGRLARTLALEAVYTSALGDEAQVGPLFDRACASAGNSTHDHGSISVCRSLCAALDGRFPEALDLAAEAEAALRDRPGSARWETAMTTWARAMALLQLGRVQALGAMLPRALQDLEGRGDLLGLTLLRVGPATQLRMLRDAVGPAEVELDGALASWAASSFQLPHAWGLAARVRLRLYAGDRVGALALLDTHAAAIETAKLHRLPALRSELLGLRAASSITAAAASPAMSDRLLSAASTDARALAAASTCSARPLGLLLGALVESARRRDDAARAGLREAIPLLEAQQLGLHAAAARWRLGELTQGSEGQRLVEEAQADLRSRGVVRPEAALRQLAPSARA